MYMKELPEVSEAFFQRRRLEEEVAFKKRRILAEQNEREERAVKAIADRKAAVAELKNAKNDSRSRKHSGIHARY